MIAWTYRSLLFRYMHFRLHPRLRFHYSSIFSRSCVCSKTKRDERLCNTEDFNLTCLAVFVWYRFCRADLSRKVSNSCVLSNSRRSFQVCGISGFWWRNKSFVITTFPCRSKLNVHFLRVRNWINNTPSVKVVERLIKFWNN